MIMAKQVKVQAVSELVINQMNAATYFEEKAAGRLKDSEVYVVEPEKQGASVDAFYQWLKERNYDMGNFRGLEGVFPVKDFPEIKAANLAGGDTQIIGTGAPNAIVEYEGKQTRIGSNGSFVFNGISPLVDGDLIQIVCYDYAGRKKTFSIAVGNIEYAVPEGTTEITSSTVAQYNLNRAGKLVFPPSVETVDGSAFNGSSAITDISLPGVTNITSYAFYNCTSLIKVSLPVYTCVRSGLFRGCTSLTYVYLPSCTEIEDYAFNNCSSMTSISLPKCTTIGDSAFRDCSSLTSVSMPLCANVVNYAFLGCNKLKTVILSDGWTPSADSRIPTSATVYNPDKTKKVNWSTMSWVNV